MAILATTRGIPQLYYGSEIGMAGDKSFGDGAIRQDFPGGWANDKENAFTKQGRNPMQEQFYNFTAKLFQWRKTNEAVHFGKMTHYLPENNVYVYFRYNKQKTVMVILNNSTEIQTLNGNRFTENTQIFTSGKDILTGKTITIKENFTIEPQSVFVLELQ